MLAKDKMKTMSHHIGAMLIAGVVVLGGADAVSAFATAGSPSSETCEFSLQLQSSVSVRQQYLVKLDAILGDTADSAVEDMYGNIRQASYNAEADDSEEKIDFWGFASIKKASAVELDSFSADCVGCHDGVGASSIGLDLRNRPHDRTSRVTSFKSDHPIGMNYESYVGANRGYKPIMPHSNKMLFVNGKVGCLTCHNPLNPEKGHLVMSDRNSALCKTCHDK